MNRAESSTIKTETPKTPKTTTPKVQKEEIEIQKDSLTYWKNIVSEETKYRDALVKDTDKWKEHNDKIIEAQKHIDEITGDIKTQNNIIEGSRKYFENELNLLREIQNEADPFSDAYDKAGEQIRDVELALKSIDLMDSLKIDPPTISSLESALSLLKQIQSLLPIGSEDFKKYGEWIDKVQKKLNESNGVEIKAPKTDTWESFNSAMANTATIVQSLSSTFKDSSEITAASILQMVATSLPAIGSLIGAIGALTSVEAAEAGVAAVGKAVSTSKHWIEAIAAVASLAAVVASAISAAQSSARASNYASGGIVPGQSFTGDRVSANVNSGEMILNRSQQTRLFQIANGGGTVGNREVTFHISGTELVGVLNNQTRKNNLIR